jgi:hypothetical protein
VSTLWHDKLADVLRDMGFKPSPLRRTFDEKGDHYEYLAVYVDDIAIASKDPKAYR